MRSREEIEARRNIIALSINPVISGLYDDCVKATKGMSPSSAFNLSMSIGNAEMSQYSMAIAKAVRWHRVLVRDYNIPEIE
jgi:hypothetical protein